tara:strand:- start:4187 stop:5173 length:987 start_codon:yes stop_codon:yes gene_type:complete
MTVVKNIIRSLDRSCSNSNENPLNILVIFQGNEKYVTLLANNTAHNFYILPDQSWNSASEPQPENVYRINSCSDALDFILCFNRAEHYDQAQTLSRQLQLPIILVDLCSRNLIRPQHLAESISVKDMNLLDKKPCYQVSSSEYIQNSWNAYEPATIIPIGIDSDKYINTSLEQQDQTIALDNNIPQEIGNMIQMQIKPPYKLIPTDNTATATPDFTDIAVNKAHYFINPYKTVTIKMLEAMSSGALVICIRSPDTESIITHLSNGLIINNIDELAPTLNIVENDPSLYNKIIKTARDQIISQHSLNTYKTKWNEVFERVRSLFYTPHI